jgi:hypothetical protein
MRSAKSTAAVARAHIAPIEEGDPGNTQSAVFPLHNCLIFAIRQN